METSAHDRLQPLVYEIFRPEISTPVLDPLEVRNRHPARIGEDVRNDKDPVFVEDGIRGGGRWAVCSFTDYARFDVAGITGSDDVLQRGGQQHVDVERQQICPRYYLGFAVAVERPILLHVRNRVIDIDPAGVVERDRPVSDRHDLAALAC